MAGPVPAIHVFLVFGAKTWMPGSRPGMTSVLYYPRPTNGIFDAMTVMNSTLASSGSVAM
jgi:hypothetical protein